MPVRAVYQQVSTAAFPWSDRIRVPAEYSGHSKIITTYTAQLQKLKYYNAQKANNATREDTMYYIGTARYTITSHIVRVCTADISVHILYGWEGGARAKYEYLNFKLLSSSRGARLRSTCGNRTHTAVYPREYIKYCRCRVGDRG